jgi:hypothetical protein
VTTGATGAANATNQPSVVGEDGTRRHRGAISTHCPITTDAVRTIGVFRVEIHAWGGHATGAANRGAGTLVRQRRTSASQENTRAGIARAAIQAGGT